MDSNTGMDPTSQLPAEFLTPNYINPTYATPAQIAQLRLYSNELMKPQPVQHWAQGLGEVARSLMGGYLGRQSDLREAAGQQQVAGQTADVYSHIMPSSEAQPGGASGTNSPASAATGASPASSTGAQIYLGLRARGFSDPQAAALTGNIQQESGFNPSMPNPKEGGLGLLQWNGSRLANLQQFAAQQNKPTTDLNVQLDFIKHEMSGAEAPNAQAFLRAGDLTTANAALAPYIRYGDHSGQARLQNAQSYSGMPAAQSRSVADLPPVAAAQAGGPTGSPPVPGATAASVPALPPTGAPSPASTGPRADAGPALPPDALAFNPSGPKGAPEIPPAAAAIAAAAPSAGPAMLAPPAGVLPGGATGDTLQDRDGNTIARRAVPWDQAVAQSKIANGVTAPDSTETTPPHAGTYAGVPGLPAPAPTTQPPPPGIENNPIAQKVGALTPQEVGAILSNPNMPDETKQLVRSLVEPKLIEDGIGNKYVYTYADLAAHRPPQLWMPGVMKGEISGDKVQTIITGTPGNLHTQMLIPGADTGAPGAPGAPSSPGAPGGSGGPLPQQYMDLRTQQARLAAQQKEFEDESAKRADLLTKYQDAGVEAQGQMNQIQALTDLGDKVGYGITPVIQEKLGQLGLRTKGLSDIQAYQSVIQNLIPNLRPPGSGTLKDSEIHAFTAAVGGLMTTPEGRHIIAQNLQLMAQYKAQVGQIAGDTRLTSDQRMARIQSLPAPHLVIPGSDSDSMPPTAASTKVPASPIPGGSPDSATLREAADAIARGAPADAVITRLQKAGVDTAPLVEALRRQGARK